MIRWAWCTVLLLSCSDRTEGANDRLDPSDFDRDGHSSLASGGDDCDDRDPTVRPDAVETCDGRDEDCDGAADEGFDCIAGSERACGRFAGMRETCNPGCAWSACAAPEPQPCGECRIGESQPCETVCGTTGMRVCGVGCVFGECTAPRERCNGLDDDCDGAVDEGTLGVSGDPWMLPWTGPSRVVSTAVVDDRIFVASSLAEDSGTPVPHPTPPFGTWLDSNALPLGEPILLDPDPEVTAFKLDTVAVDGEVAVVWTALGYTRFAWVSPDGVRASNEMEDFGGPPIAMWTGQEVVVLSTPFLFTFDRDANLLTDRTPLESTHDPGWPGSAAWTADGVVTISHDGFLTWSALDGSLVREVDLDFRSDYAAVASDDQGISVAYEGTERTFLVRLDLGGVELWRVEEPKSRDTHLFGIERWGDRTVVGTYEYEFYEALSGWIVDRSGASIQSPSWWTWFNRAASAGRYRFEIASVAGNDYIFLADESILVAPLGCAVP